MSLEEAAGGESPVWACALRDQSTGMSAWKEEARPETTDLGSYWDQILRNAGRTNNTVDLTTTPAED